MSESTKTSTRVIWVYRIPITTFAVDATNVFHIPIGSRFLTLGVQGDSIAMWFEVPDATATTEQRGFQIFGTGFADIRAGLDYRGTVQVASLGGQLVLHVYEDVAQPYPYQEPMR